MSYTVKTSDPDPEFLNAGKKNGVLVWRIENFAVKKVNPNDHGILLQQFHSKDLLDKYLICLYVFFF